MCRYMHFRVDYRAILCYFFKKVDSQVHYYAETQRYI